MWSQTVIASRTLREAKSGHKDDDLLTLETDMVLFLDPVFASYAEKFANDQDAFFIAYANSHKKLSELGSTFYPTDGFTLDL